MIMASIPQANASPIRRNRLSESKMPRAPPNAAPDDTPIICGPTSGLRKIPCKAAPATARPAPASAAMRMRGIRISSITLASVDVHQGSMDTNLDARIPATCDSGTSKRPMASDTNALTIRITSRTINKVTLKRGRLASATRMSCVTQIPA